MKLNGLAGEFVNGLELSGFRLGRPKKFVFLCGGVLDRTNAKPPETAREAFLRQLPNRQLFHDYNIILAEEINAFYPDSPYSHTNLIDLEKDIAEISDSVVLFSEGIGSLAELGAFTQIAEIAQRMIVIIQETHHNAKSFVRDGPIRKLEQLRKDSVLVFDWKVDTRIEPFLDHSSFMQIYSDLSNSVLGQLQILPEKETIVQSSFAHRTFLVCALIDVCGALKLEEISFFLTTLGLTVSNSELKRILFCAEKVGWINLRKYGNTKYYFPNFHASVCDFKYNARANHKDVVRWKVDLLKFWNDTDRSRSKLISENFRREQIS